MSQLLLLVAIPNFATALQDPGTPYWVFGLNSATAGVGGGNVGVAVPQAPVGADRVARRYRDLVDRQRVPLDAPAGAGRRTGACWGHAIHRARADRGAERGREVGAGRPAQGCPQG